MNELLSPDIFLHTKKYITLQNNKIMLVRDNNKKKTKTFTLPYSSQFGVQALRENYESHISIIRTKREIT